MQTLWEHRYAQRLQRMSSSAIRELLKLTTQSDMISFAGGLPAPEVFPVAEFAEASVRVLKEFGAQALQRNNKLCHGRATRGHSPLMRVSPVRTYR